MREKKWTKGPWELREHPSNDDFFVEAQNHGFKMPYDLDVCGEDYTGFGDEEVRRANYTIISAAPELVEALEELKTQIQQVADGDRPYTGFDTELMDFALAKAYGETP